jgi:hypothetical protein
MEQTDDELEQFAIDWWESRRRHFNMTLISNAPISFAGVLLIWFVFGFRLPCLDITFFIIFFSALFFIIALPLANLAYLLGSKLETGSQPAEIMASRHRLYKTGLCFWLFIIFLPVIVNLAWLATGHSLTVLC